MFQKQSPCGLYRRHLKEGANGVIVKKGCVVIPAINNRFSIQGKRPSKQQGATLIEVMVAIFVLAFGVLALMVAQLRSVSSVQEAENQTVVAQAAQTLMEGMLVNPVVSVVGGSTNKDYAVYAQGDVLALCPINANGDYPDNSVIDKATLAQRQLCRFSTDLQTKLPNLTNLNAEVCRGNPQNGACNQAPNIYIITVSWGMQAGDATGAAQGMADADGVVTYRYVLPVQD